MLKTILLIVFSFCSNYLILQITFEELDYIRLLADESSNSIIENGTKTCNKYFDENKYSISSNKYENFFMCKFSKKRNRFYIFMLAVEKSEDSSLKEFCIEKIKTNQYISDHMDSKLAFQKKRYLSGFYVENFFNDKVLNFQNDLIKDKLKINNEINDIILKNRKKFTDDNQENNNIVSKEINKLNKIYKKIISNSESDLDKLIKSQLEEIVRYKIFINDIKNFKSYSCNWQPGKGLSPYVKREKFEEFENI